MAAKNLPLFVFAGFLISCSNVNHKELPGERKDTIPHSRQPAFKGVALASKKDVACGMPVSAGITDTAHYKGNIYGFCSKACKAEFIKSPKQYLPKS